MIAPVNITEINVSLSLPPLSRCTDFAFEYFTEKWLCPFFVRCKQLLDVFEAVVVGRIADFSFHRVHLIEWKKIW